MINNSSIEHIHNSDIGKGRTNKRIFINDIKPYIMPLLIYGIFLIIMFLTIANKRNLHVDEICSYILANNAVSVSIEFEEGYTYEFPELVWIGNMVVADDLEQLNIKNVWENQSLDVHPPLYYLILHIISFINRGKFSVWYAAAINICFALLTLYIFRKLLFLCTKDTVIVSIGSILFILSVGILQNVSFLRMYVMAMFWVTATTYLFVKVFEEKFSWKLWIYIFFIAVAGALTHYYCIIYLCAISLVLGVCLMIERKWKDIAALASSTMTAGITAIIIFPAMIQHMFSGHRGTQSIDNLTKGTWNEHWERIKSFYGFINTQMLGKIGGVGLVFVILVVAVFIHNRLIPIYAVTLAVFLCIMSVFFRKLMEVEKSYVLMCFVGAIIIINGFANADWAYLYKSSTDFLNTVKTYSDRNCISVYDAKWKEQPSFYEMKNYESVTFISQENVENILQYEDLFDREFILNVIGGNDEKIINLILENYPYLSGYEKIGGYGYATTYRIFADEEWSDVYIYDYDKNKLIGADGSEQGNNVQLAQNGLSVWLYKQDENYIIIKTGKLVLDVKGGLLADGTNIQLYPANGTDAQCWKIAENEDGSITFLSKDEKFALACGSDGNVYLAEFHAEENAQKWWIQSKTGGSSIVDK